MVGRANWYHTIVLVLEKGKGEADCTIEAASLIKQRAMRDQVIMARKPEVGGVALLDNLVARVLRDRATQRSTKMDPYGLPR